VTGPEALVLLSAGGSVVAVRDHEVEIRRRVARDLVVRLHATLAEAHAQAWLVIQATVDHEDRWVSRSALHYNATLAIGAVALVAGDYVVRHAIPLGRSTIEEIDETIAILAEEAAALRCSFVAGSSHADTPFAQFAD
jgi:hypothetical protein